jgi:O-antigen ligase
VSRFALASTWRIDKYFALQWLAVGAVGVAVGIFVLLVSPLPGNWSSLFVFAGLCPFLAMVFGNLRRLLLAIVVLDFPLQIGINLGFRADAAAVGAFYGYNVSAGTLALAALYALWLSGQLAGREPRPRPWLGVSLAPLLYFCIVAASVVIARDQSLALFEVFSVLQLLLLYIYIVGTVRTRQDVVFLFTMLLAGLVLESLIMIGLQFVGHGISLGALSGRIDYGSSPSELASRSGGTVGSPNIAGAYLSLLLAPAIGFLMVGLGRGYKSLTALALGLGVVALISTFSRGSWAATALSLMLLFLLAWRRGLLPLKVPLIFGVIGGLLLMLSQNAILARLLINNGDITNGRAVLMELAWRMIQDHAVFGVGANNYATALGPYLTPDFAGDWIYTVHNRYLLDWAETGIFGLGTFLWFLIATLVRGWRLWRRKDRFLSPLALAISAAMLGNMAQMFLEVFNGPPIKEMVFLWAALLAAMQNMDEA